MPEFRLQVPHGKLRVHTRLRVNKSGRRPVTFVFAHGLGAQMNDSLFVGCAQKLESVGYPSVRFNAYGEHDDSRRFGDYTIETQADDLDAVIDHIKDLHPGQTQSPLVVAVGHCLGAYAVLASKKKRYDAIVLLTHGELDLGQTLGSRTIQSGQPLLVEWSLSYVVNSELVEQYQAFDPMTTARSISVPTFTISDRDPRNQEQARRFIDACAADEKLAVDLEEADHWFSTDTAMEQLVTTLTSIGRQTTSREHLAQLLGSESIENHVIDIVELIARRTEQFADDPDATTVAHLLLGRLSGRRMLTMFRLQANRGRQSLTPTDFPQLLQRRERLRHMLRKKLSELNQNAAAVETFDFKNGLTTALFGTSSIGRYECEIREVNSQIRQVIASFGPSESATLVELILQASIDLPDAERSEVLGHLVNDAKRAANCAVAQASRLQLEPSEAMQNLRLYLNSFASL